MLSSAVEVEGLPDGIRGWTTTRAAGSFGLGSGESVGAVMDRWSALQDALATVGATSLATASQVHEGTVAIHNASWTGWLRQRGVDGHVTTIRGRALAVTVADCTPVFVAHPDGAVAALHAGWRGTAARILDVGLDAMEALGFPAAECAVHLGPAICGACYEVGPEVLSAVTGRAVDHKGLLDVREVLAQQATDRRVHALTVAQACTRCQNDRFYSHRAGDAGRQLGIIVLGASQ